MGKHATSFAFCFFILFCFSSKADESASPKGEKFREKESFLKELQDVPTLEEIQKETEAEKIEEEKFFKRYFSGAGIGYLYFEDSDEDRTRQVTERVELYRSDRVLATYGNDLVKFEDRGSPNIYLNTNWIDLDAAFNENLSGSVYYGFKDYHNGGGDENVFAATLNTIFKERLLTSLNFSHFDVIQNSPAILENIETNQWTSAFDWILTKDLSMQWGYTGSDYSDSNFSNSYYGQATYVWWQHPIVTTAYQYSYTTFSSPSDFYFSFDDFQNHLITFSWEQNLSENFGVAFRNRISTDNSDPGAWSSELSGEVYYSYSSALSFFLQYSYYDNDLLEGDSFTSNTAYVSVVLSF